MKIGFAGRWSPLDKKSWSGTYFFSYNEIKKYGDVEIFHFPYPKWLSTYLINVYKKPQNFLRRRNVAVEFLKDYARHYSKKLEKELVHRKIDILFVASAPQLFAYANLEIPVIFLTDGTFYQIQGYYETWKNFAPFSIRQGIEVDKRAFLKSTHIMAASEWTRQSAIHDYDVDPSTISVVPLGANLEHIPSEADLDFSTDCKCRLLFLGVEWHRKGGDIALGAFYRLKKKGIKAKLQIVGCIPPVQIDDPDVTVIPFLDKNNPHEFSQLNNILLHTDFLLLPTRAECAGIVFCEASAYGIPSITTDTGGVGTYVRNGENGFTLPPQAGPEEYALQLEQVITNPHLLVELKKRSRHYYDNTLSWEVWGKRFNEIACNCLQQVVT
jgi:glycosyltransferase involved in cell wall biosynthesis